MSDAIRQIADDRIYALTLARQEYQAAGLHKQTPASDEAVVCSQQRRYATLQEAARQRPAPCDAFEALAGAPRQAKHGRPKPPQLAAPKPKKKPRLTAPSETTASATRSQRVASAPAVTAPSRAALEDKLRRRPDMLQDLAPNATLVKVKGDGNCGYYALLAGLVRVAMAQFRRSGTSSVAAGLQKLPQADTERPAPTCERGRAVLAHYGQLIEAGQGEQALAAMESDFGDVHAAQMALRSARAKLDDRSAHSADRAWADSGDLKALALHLGVDANVYTTDVHAFEAEGAMHPVRIAQAGKERDQVEIVHGSVHYDLLLPNG